MPIFLWEGKNAAGKFVKGEIEARDIQAVFNTLRSQRLIPNASRIREKGKGFEAEIKIPGFGPKVKAKDVVIFTRQFATMIDSGLPIVQGLDVLAKQNDNPAFKKVLLAVKEHVENGGTLAEGLKKHPKVFDDLYTNMIDAGENGGILDIILERVAVHLEKSLKLKREIKTAMIYPAVVVSAAVIVTAVLLIFVIPTFAELFQDFGAALPLPTQIVINMSNFVVENVFVLFGGLFAVLIFGFRFMRTERGREVMHPLFLRLPIFGDIIRKVSVARFTRTLGTMLSSGVPILEALNICARTAGNKVVEKDVLRARISISEGKSMTEPLSESPVFPPMVVQMIGVGEQTGALDAMLQKIADFYEEEVDNAVTAMKQLIEPLMILFLGVIVGGLIIAMYLPIFKMGSVVG
ncbi:MAG: type II secretion system F family protein [SAR324 cluster bacterium]|uniref:Type II secretion system F family protein n=1 Tax=SAR324 cluster bacterium TaxID=2024889 RepID=A0A7X9FRQ8_9DELT|nr:type II secretion system F family protein [SAR324 cluster bacterium]